jgi:hypothetical protein
MGSHNQTVAATDTKTVSSFAVPAMLIPQDGATSRESIMTEALALDCRLRALRLREDVAT